MWHKQADFLAARSTECRRSACSHSKRTVKERVKKKNVKNTWLFSGLTGQLVHSKHADKIDNLPLEQSKADNRSSI